MTYGGMLQVVLEETEIEKQKLLKTLFRNSYIKDIIERHNVRKIDRPFPEKFALG